MVFFTDIARGKFEEAEKKIDKLAEIGRVFDYNIAASWHLIIAARFFLAMRNLDQAMSFVNQYIAYSKKIDDLPPVYWGYSTKAMIQVLSHDLNGAEESLRLARNYPQGQKLKVYSTIYVTVRFMIDLVKLEDAITSKRNKDISKLKKNAWRSGKLALKDAAVLSDNRIENYRHMGTYYWLSGKQNKALKWWAKAMKIGEKYHAMPELARVYMEAGKRMAGDKTTSKLIHGKTPAECLARAASIFKEYHLYHDLEEMEKVSLHRE
jgi:tetratricopeptide (TPR) repeat protein